MEEWSVGVVEYWSVRVLVLWCDGVLERWSVGLEGLAKNAISSRPAQGRCFRSNRQHSIR
jgi:hypothetical protein